MCLFIDQVVNYLLRGWIKNVESQGRIDLPLLEGSEHLEHGLSKELEFVKDGTRKSVRVNVRGSKLSLWRPLSSFLMSGILGSGATSL